MCGFIFFQQLGDYENRQENSEGLAAVIFVEKGDSLRSIAKKIQGRGLIKNSFVFEFLARFFNIDRQIKPGGYRIGYSVSVNEILKILSNHPNVNYKVTIPEGQTSFEVVKRLNKVELLEDVLTNIPKEGYLSPNTYFYVKGDSRKILVQKMIQDQKNALARIWENRSRDSLLQTEEELLILASIIEKESGLHSELKLISSVLHNRLKKNMRLQADPTVIYGITKGRRNLGRSLLRKDIKVFSEYNTYHFKGLPKTPICNPGEKALIAAAHPAESSYLFYVANGEGGHNFSTTLEQHNKNVKIWRKLNKEIE